MAKLPVRKKVKKTGVRGRSASKPGASKVQLKKNFKKKNIEKNQSPAVSSTKPKPSNKTTPTKAPIDQSGTAKPSMHKKRHRGGKGRGGRRVKKGKPIITKKKIILKERYKSGKEKDQKLMKKFARVKETPTVKKDTKIDPKQLINLDMLQAAISGLRKLPSAGKSERKSLHDITDEDERPVYLQVTLCKLPKVTEDLHLAGPTTVNVYLPHPLVTDNTDVILITKDLQRGIRTDHQNSLDHFKELLHSQGAASLVNEVIPLRQLKVEYKEFEAKRLLANRTDVLLCDDTVIRVIPKYLSKYFYIKRKLPVQVNLKAKDLQKELLRALSVSRLFFSMKGNSSIMKVGRMGQSDEEIQENVLEAVRKLANYAPGDWNNIQSLSLKLESTQSIPLYVKMDSLNSVKPLPEKCVFPGEIVAGTLNTQPNRCITVFPDGNITATRLKKNKKRIAEEEETIIKEGAKKAGKEADSTAGKKGKKSKKAKATAQENGLEGKPETSETESSGAKDKTKKSTKRKGTDKTTSKTKKQKKARDSDSDSDSGEDDLEEQELMYLKQLNQRDEEPAVEEEEAEDSDVDVWGESESDMDDSD